MKLVGDTTINIPAWCSCHVSVLGLRCTGNAIVEPLDVPLTGGFLLQTGLMGSTVGRFEVTIRNPSYNTTLKQSRRTVLCVQQRLSVGINTL